jgi:hypothetical protein
VVKVEMDESSSNPYFDTDRKLNVGRREMLSIRYTLDKVVDWLVENVRSFSYLLPDSIELALYVCLIIYFATQLGQQTA